MTSTLTIGRYIYGKLTSFGYQQTLCQPNSKDAAPMIPSTVLG
jgi:hypothetical protein